MSLVALMKWETSKSVSVAALVGKRGEGSAGRGEAYLGKEGGKVMKPAITIGNAERKLLVLILLIVLSQCCSWKRRESCLCVEDAVVREAVSGIVVGGEEGKGGDLLLVLLQGE